MWTVALAFLRGNWKQIVIGLAVVGAIWAAYSWAYGRGADSRQSEIDQVSQRLAAVTAEHNRQVAAAEAAAKARETAMQARLTEAAKELDNEYRTNAEMSLALDALRRPPVELSRMRDALATSRLAAEQASANSAAACHDRAAAYEARIASGARLLQEGQHLAGRVAAAHDARAAEVEALVRAWPQ